MRPHERRSRPAVPAARRRPDPERCRRCYGTCNLSSTWSIHCTDMAPSRSFPAPGPCVDPETAGPVGLPPQGRPMGYKLTIELSDRDLRHFRRELRKARESVQIADDEEILGAAADLVGVMRGTDLP